MTLGVLVGPGLAAVAVRRADEVVAPAEEHRAELEAPGAELGDALRERAAGALALRRRRPRRTRAELQALRGVPAVGDAPVRLQDLVARGGDEAVAGVGRLRVAVAEVVCGAPSAPRTSARLRWLIIGDVEVACHAQVVAVLLEAGGELATVLRVVAVESSAPVSLRRIAENRPRLRPGDSIGVGP